MIKTFVFALLFVATISLTLHHCSSGYTYVITLGKCEPISKLCSVNQYYDKKHHACYTKSLQCSVGQTYDSKTHKCIAINTKCSKGYVFSKQLQHCVKKIVCSAGYVLNKQYQVCQKKPIKCAKNQKFDYLTQKCVAAQYTTSPFQPHLITSGSFTSFVRSYSKTKRHNKNLTNCPANKPYYQKSSGICISCSGKYPYFDVTTDKCVNCPFSQYYNPAMHKCISQTRIPHYPSTISRIGY